MNVPPRTTMQYNHTFYGNSFPSRGQLYRSQSPCPYSSHQLHPDVVGEGNVTTVVLPDGGLQCYFLPDTNTSRWYSFNPTLAQNCNHPHWNNNAGMWFIRNISNPMPIFNQPIQRGCAVNYFAPHCTSDCNLNTPQGFQLKFHNDNCTSTTDLHYFFPRPRPHVITNFTPDLCKTVQVNTGVTCKKPCHCEHRTYETKSVKNNQTQSDTDECMCSDSAESTKSNMSVDKTKQINYRSQRQNKSRKEQKDKSRKRSRTKVREKRNKHTCLCAPPPADKAVVTYSDKGCNSVTDTGCETRPARECNTWHPISAESKKAMKLCDCDTDCCTSANVVLTLTEIEDES